MCERESARGLTKGKKADLLRLGCPWQENGPVGWPRPFNTHPNLVPCGTHISDLARAFCLVLVEDRFFFLFSRVGRDRFAVAAAFNWPNFDNHK